VQDGHKKTASRRSERPIPPGKMRTPVLQRAVPTERPPVGRHNADRCPARRREGSARPVRLAWTGCDGEPGQRTSPDRVSGWCSGPLLTGRSALLLVLQLLVFSCCHCCF